MFPIYLKSKDSLRVYKVNSDGSGIVIYRNKNMSLEIDTSEVRRIKENAEHKGIIEQIYDFRYITEEEFLTVLNEYQNEVNKRLINN